MIVNQSIIISKRSISECLNKIGNWIQNLDTNSNVELHLNLNTFLLINSKVQFIIKNCPRDHSSIMSAKRWVGLGSENDNFC